MARARNIKPALFKNEILGVADPLITILFESLWCLADREGRLEDRPLRIKAETFPYRDGVDVNGYLTELQRMGFIQRYSINGIALIQIINFKKHQTPHNTEKPSELPAPNAEILISCGSQELTVKDALNNGEIPAALPPDSLNTDSLNTDSAPKEGASPSASTARKPSKKKATAIPEDFAVSDAVKTWAVKGGYVDLSKHLEFFVGRMRASGKTYVDWDQAFMNCIREDWAKLRSALPQAAANKPIIPIVKPPELPRGQKPQGLQPLKSLIKIREQA
jgi:hypothetical protein